MTDNIQNSKLGVQNDCDNIGRGSKFKVGRGVEKVGDNITNKWGLHTHMYISYPLKVY